MEKSDVAVLELQLSQQLQLDVSAEHISTLQHAMTEERCTTTATSLRNPITVVYIYFHYHCHIQEGRVHNLLN